MFHITTGDTDGVGLEITLKALQKLPASFFLDAQLCIWAHTSQTTIIKSFDSTATFIFDKNALLTSESTQAPYVFFISDESPAQWFSDVTNLCLTHNAAGVITAPMSKQVTYALGSKDLGHTEILKRLTKISNLYMGFVGQYFNVILYTDHVPLKNVAIQQESFKTFLDVARQFNKAQGLTELVLLGLNPHAGDQGLIGDEDDQISKLLKKWNLDSEVSLPVPADSAFVHYTSNPKKTYLSLYHDQGLIPFKMAHGFSGYHTTLGLPFVRTSVDHGTAKEIFNKNVADATSMYEAILGAKQIFQGRSL